MFRAIGAVLVLWYLSLLFSNTFAALDDALSASFRTFEAAALSSSQRE